MEEGREGWLCETGAVTGELEIAAEVAFESAGFEAACVEAVGVPDTAETDDAVDEVGATGAIAGAAGACCCVLAAVVAAGGNSVPVEDPVFPLDGMLPGTETTAATPLAGIETGACAAVCGCTGLAKGVVADLSVSGEDFVWASVELAVTAAPVPEVDALELAAGLAEATVACC